MAKKKNVPAKPLLTAKDIEAGNVDVDDMFRLLKAGEKGDKSTVPAIRVLMQKGGRTAWNLVAKDIHQDIALERFYGTNYAAIEAERCRLEERRKELEGPNPSGLERLLVDRILMCLVAVQYAEGIYHQSSGNRTWEQDEYHQKRIGRAQHRFLAAVESLARIRKMQLPDLNIHNPGQINIGQQQVNVAQQDATCVQTDAATAPRR